MQANGRGRVAIKNMTVFFPARLARVKDMAKEFFAKRFQ